MYFDGFKQLLIHYRLVLDNIVVTQVLCTSYSKKITFLSYNLYLIIKCAACFFSMS